MMGNSKMRHTKLNIIFVVCLLLIFNLHSNCEKNNSMNDFLKIIVKDYSDNLVNDCYMKNLVKKFTFINYNLVNSESFELKKNSQKPLTIDLVYSKNKGEILESIILQFKEQKDYIKVSELVKVFGKWVYRSKHTKNKSISFMFKNFKKKEYVRIRCTGIFWKDKVKTLKLCKMKIID